MAEGGRAGFGGSGRGGLGSALLTHDEQLGALELPVGLLLQEGSETARRDGTAHAGDHGDDDDQQHDHDDGAHADSLSACTRPGQHRPPTTPADPMARAPHVVPVKAQASISMSAWSGSSDTAK